MPGITPGTPLHSFLDAVCKAASNVFSQALSGTWSVGTTDSTPSAETSPLCFQLSVSGALQGGASIQMGTVDALLLAQKFLQESVDPSAELNGDHREALSELLRQVAGLATTSLKSLFGEANLEVSNGEPPSWQGIDVALLASEASSGNLPFTLRLSSELLASLSSTKAAAQVPVAIADVATTSPTGPHESKFDLLLGVNLNLTLRFGQRVLPLREILDLTSGSVIELDREVQEPADLLLGDKLIARGEVVIVDGNYGIRITEVADARQQIGAL
jgi:flagellar motor switch protein FliN